MNPGQIAILLAFFSSIAAAFSFYRDDKNGENNLQPKRKLSSKLYSVALGTGIIASALLYYLLLTHQFQYSYVARYSSNGQPLLYLISAFWAGQEGTFLLWALFVSVMGLAFMKTSKQGHGFEMSIVSGFLAFLYLLILVKSPFEVTTNPPNDGSGMNPLLQNPWMVIHPPMLFIGYAATIFPFALVV